MSIFSCPAFFSPKQFPGLFAWYDGNDPNGTGVQPNDATAVTTWVDKAGNNNQVQNTGGNKLVFKTNIKNGRGVMRSTTVNQYMAGGVVGMQSGSGARTCFYVAMTTDGNQNNIIFDYGTAAVGQHWAALMTTTFGGAITAFCLDNSGQAERATTTTLTNSSYFRMSINYTAASNINTAIMVVNGTNQSTTGSAAAPNTVLTSSAMCSYVTATTSYALVGDVCEILMYNTSLNASQMNAVNYYLKSKWGV